MIKEINKKSFPPSFKYKNVYIKGKPLHDLNDNFSIKHPAMDLTKRAKIFNPFDALKGFDNELATTQQAIEESYADNGYVPIEEFP